MGNSETTRHLLMLPCSRCLASSVLLLVTFGPEQTNKDTDVKRTAVADMALREVSSSAVGARSGRRAASALSASLSAARACRPVKEPANGDSADAYRSSSSFSCDG